MQLTKASYYADLWLYPLIIIALLITEFRSSSYHSSDLLNPRPLAPGTAEGVRARTRHAKTAKKVGAVERLRRGLRL